jgi:hypothetical protein
VDAIGSGLEARAGVGMKRGDATSTKFRRNSVTCRFCRAAGLAWRKLGGRWILVEGRRMHPCFSTSPAIKAPNRERTQPAENLTHPPVDTGWRGEHRDPRPEGWAPPKKVFRRRLGPEELRAWQEQHGITVAAENQRLAPAAERRGPTSPDRATA